MSTEDEDPPRNVYVVPPSRPEPLDFTNLPQEFTPEVYGRLRHGDIKRLLREADELGLTELQRDSLNARQAEMAERIRRVFEDVQPVWPRFNKVDPLGEEIRQSLAHTVELTRPIDVPRPDTSYVDAIDEMRAAEEERAEREHELLQSMARNMALLAARTEQQHLEAGRQRLLTWVLAYVALVATAGTLVQIGWVASWWVLGGAAALLLAMAWWQRREPSSSRSD